MGQVNDEYWRNVSDQKFRCLREKDRRLQFWTVTMGG